MDKWERLNRELEQIREKNLLRKMTVFDTAQSSVVEVEGKREHLFSSNSYLDMCNEPAVKEYARRILDEYGIGSGGSRLTTGTTRIHMQLEETIAAFKKREAALVFNTGYMANVGILSALAGRGDIIYSDELNHASIIDGCRLSRADLVIYRHNDMDDLEEKIKAHPGRRGVQHGRGYRESAADGGAGQPLRPFLHDRRGPRHRRHRRHRARHGGIL